MDATLRQIVWARANAICEYCHVPQALDALPFHLEHIIAKKHSGETTSENLALACFNCNVAKGTNLAGIDPATSLMERLFHPRNDRWSEHFSWNGSLLVGLTAIGRTTIDVLNINAAPRIEHRRLLLANDWQPVAKGES